MALKFDKNLSGTLVPDELHNSLGSGFYSLDHDTFWGGVNFDIWTGAGETGTHLIENTHYTLHDEDTVLTAESGATVYTTLKITDPTYQACDLYFTYKTIGDYNEAADINDIYDAIDDSIADIAGAGRTVETVKQNADDIGAKITGLAKQIAKAWVSFYGTTIRDSFNVSSITSYGTGTYGINFINAMPDTNYCVVGSAGGNVIYSCIVSPYLRYTTYARVRTTTHAGSWTNAPDINVAIFGG